MQYLSKSLVIFTIILISLPSFADEKKLNKENEQKPIKEKMVVTATRESRNISTIPANISVITREDIEKSSAITVPELLRNLAGINITFQSNAYNSLSLDIRGFGGEIAKSNILILVDGRRLNRPDLSQVDWMTIPMSLIEKIEVIRGGRAVLYGDHAVGGVVNIITRKHTGDFSTLSLKTLYGSNETSKLSLSTAGKQGATTYFANYTHFQTDGFRDNNSYQNNSGGFSLIYDDNGRFTMSFSGGVKFDQYGLPGGRAGSKRTTAKTPNKAGKSRDKYLNAIPRWQITENLSFDLALSLRESENYFRNVTFANSRFILREYAIKPKLVLKTEHGFGKNTLILGYDHSNNVLHQVFGGTGPTNRSQRSNGFYFMDTIAFLDESLFLDFGYRREKVSYNLNGNGIEKGPFNIDVATLGLTYKYQDKSKIFISFDKSFKASLIDELATSSFNTVLPPQKTFTYQAGVSHTFNKKINANLTYFYIKTQGELFFDPSVPGPSFNGQNDNYDYTYRKGFEFETKYKPIDWLSLFLAYTYIDGKLGENRKTTNSFKGNEIPGVSDQSVSFGGEIKLHKNLSLALSNRWYSELTKIGDFAGSLPKQESAFITDVSLTYTKNWLTIFLNANNVFNQHYNYTEAKFGTFPAPGTEVFMGFSVNHEF